MSLSDRRTFLLGLPALLALPACQMQPALGTNSAGRQLFGQIEVIEPSNRNTYFFVQQFEERLGRGGDASPYVLTYSLSMSSSRLGTASSGSTQRIHLAGEARFALRRRGEAGAIASGDVHNFVGYSNTGNTVSTAASSQDARRRLSIILADDVVERLFLSIPDITL